MEQDEVLEDVLVLSNGHSILAPQIPGSEKPGQFSSKMSKDTISKFGLFGGGNNYGTFYPEATKEDWTPKDDEFIEPTFRLLSNVIVSKDYNPTEFPADVLKNSMDKLVGQTVNCDHETDILNAIGSIKEVFWQEAYTTDDGIVIPAGINGRFKIDAKANPRIARGIMMDPPSIHSNSVTVRFSWKPSHEFEKPWEFYNNLGTIASDGQLVRRIATNILGYMETSLVWHGADPFAQKVNKSGQIVLPSYSKSYYDQQQNSEKKPVEKKRYLLYSVEDFKDLAKGETIEKLEEPSKTQNETTGPKISNENFNKKPMENEELERFTATVIAVLGLNKEEKHSLETIASSLKQLKEDYDALKVKKTEVDEKVASIEKENKELKSLAEIGKTHLASFRDLAITNYKKLNGENADQAVLTLLGDEATSYTVIKTLNDTYTAALEEKFPMTCNKCGSHDVGRNSSVHHEEEEENLSEKVDDRKIIENVVKRISKKDNK